MKRFIAVFLAVLMLCSIMVTASAEEVDASKDPVVTLIFGGTSSAEDNISIAMQRIADLCAERSGGTIKISVFPASQLGDAVAQMESTIGGAQDMFVEAQASYMQQYGIPETNINNLGLITNQEKLAKELDSPLWAEWEAKFLENTGLRTLGHNYIRPQVAISSNVPFYKPEDINGIKCRTTSSSIMIDSYNVCGFQSTPVAYGEVYLSLQQGVIDATMGSLDSHYTMGFYEVSKYLCMFTLSCPNFGIWINDAKFQSMTEAQQQILLDVVNECGDWYTETNNAMVDGYVDKIKEAGVEVITYDDAVMQPIYDKLADLAHSYEEAGKWTPGTYDAMAEYLKNN